MRVHSTHRSLRDVRVSASVVRACGAREESEWMRRTTLVREAEAAAPEHSREHSTPETLLASTIIIELWFGVGVGLDFRVGVGVGVGVVVWDGLDIGFGSGLGLGL